VLSPDGKWLAMPCSTLAMPAASNHQKRSFLSNVFLRRGFTSNAPGPAMRLTVGVKTRAKSHEVQWSKIEAWVQSAGKPNEQAMKGGCGNC